MISLPGVNGTAGADHDIAGINPVPWLMYIYNSNNYLY